MCLISEMSIEKAKQITLSEIIEIFSYHFNVSISHFQTFYGVGIFSILLLKGCFNTW